MIPTSASSHSACGVAETPRRRQVLAAAGFTLVEVALALVVVAIGIMAAFALIGTGLDSSAKAVAETRAAIFADDIFNGLRAKSSLAYAESGMTWEEFWEDFKDGVEPVTVAAGPMWQQDVKLVWKPGKPPMVLTNWLEILAGGPHTVVFTNYSQRAFGITDVANSAVRYTLDVELSVEELPGSPGVLWTNAVKTLLNVWEGQFGSTELKDALTFTSQFMNSGRL